MSVLYVRTSPLFRKTSLSLLKIDDIPNRAEVTYCERVNELP